jgi:hypothetical protein
MSEEKSRMERILETLERIAGEDAVLIPEDIITGESWLSMRRGASVWDVVDNKIRDAEKILKNVIKDIDVPAEYRRYISRDKLSKLPAGTRVHRGPRGGLFVDVRELPEHVRESIGEEREELVRPESKVGGKKYSGWVRGGVEYNISIDPAGDIGNISISKDDYHIKFEVGIKTGRVRVLEADIPFPQAGDVVSIILDVVSRRPVNIMANSLYSAFKWGAGQLPDKPHRITINQGISEVTLDMSKKVIKGDDVNLGEYAAAYPKLRKIKDDNFHRIGDSKVFVHESLNVDAISERINKYKELIDEENVAGIFIVPSGTLVHATDAKYNAAGFHDPQNDIVVLDQWSMEYAFLHEYFHGVYAVFERLGAIDSVLSNVRNMFYDKLIEHGFTSDVMENIKVDDEVAKKVVDIIATSYSNSLIYAVIDSYLETSDKTIPRVVRQLKKVIDRYGGMRALEEFRNLIQEFLKDDGATEYSYSYYLIGQFQEEGRFVSLTEAFASFADYIEEVLDVMKRDKTFREMVMSKYGDDISKWFNKELYNQVYERSGKIHKFRRFSKSREKQLDAMSRFLKHVKGVFKKWDLRE